MGNYDDILNLPHHISRKRSHMSMIDRAAQFSPFAALTGYEAAIEETGRLTEEKVELEEYFQAVLDWKHQILIHNISSNPVVTITYFTPDAKKAGGQYQKVSGELKKIDYYNQVLLFTDERKIMFHEIVDIECALFQTEGINL